MKNLFISLVLTLLLMPNYLCASDAEFSSEGLDIGSPVYVSVEAASSAPPYDVYQIPPHNPHMGQAEHPVSSHTSIKATDPNVIEVIGLTGRIELEEGSDEDDNSETAGGINITGVKASGEELHKLMEGGKSISVTGIKDASFVSKNGKAVGISGMKVVGLDLSNWGNK